LASSGSGALFRAALKISQPKNFSLCYDIRLLMIIRPEQFAAFEDAAAEECFVFVSNFLRENAAEIITPLKPDILEQRTRKGIERARHYELDVFADVATFVYFLFKVGPRFDTFPFFESILTDPDMDPDDRMDTLVEMASDTDWLQAGQLSGPEDWDRLG
jgi:hypothetical protein